MQLHVLSRVPPSLGAAFHELLVVGPPRRQPTKKALALWEVGDTASRKRERSDAEVGDIPQESNLTGPLVQPQKAGRGTQHLIISKPRRKPGVSSSPQRWTKRSGPGFALDNFRTARSREAPLVPAPSLMTPQSPAQKLGLSSSAAGDGPPQDLQRSLAFPSSWASSASASLPTPKVKLLLGG